MNVYPLVVAQYDLQGHPRRTEHWSLAVLFSEAHAHIFEVVGNTDTFVYAPKRVNRFASSDRLRGGCHIANIRGDLIPWLEDKLREIPIIRNNPEWDCQTWVMEALRWMKYNGLVTTDIGERYIRTELVVLSTYCCG